MTPEDAQNHYLTKVPRFRDEFARKLVAIKEAATRNGYAFRTEFINEVINATKEEVRRRMGEPVVSIKHLLDSGWTPTPEVSLSAVYSACFGSYRDLRNESFSDLDNALASAMRSIGRPGSVPAEAASDVLAISTFHKVLGSLKAEASAEALAELNAYAARNALTIARETNLSESDIALSRLQNLAVGRIARLIVGDDGPKRRTATDLTMFFADAGLGQYVHDGSASRTPWTINVLKNLDNSGRLKVLKRLATRSEYDNDVQWNNALKTLNEILLSEGLCVGGSMRRPTIEVVGDDDPPIPLAVTLPKTTTRDNAKVKNQVFVIHGRDMGLRDAMFTFLRTLGLTPIEWTVAATLLNQGTPFTGAIVENALKGADAIVALFSAEEEVILKECYRDTSTDSEIRELPRPNVIFEAGLAFGAAPERTIIVRFGSVGSISDLDGRNYVAFGGSPLKRKDLVERLKAVGLNVNDAGSDWLKDGNFVPVTDKA